MPLSEGLPSWDMSVVFPGLDSPSFEAAFTNIEHGLDELEALFASRGVGSGGSEDVEVFDEVLGAFNRVSDELRTLAAYIHAFTTTDSRDELASARNSEIEFQLGRIRKLTKALTGWVKGLDLEDLLEKSQLARDHTFALTKAKVAAQHLMSAAEEALASDLEITGTSAWSKLQSNIVSQLVVNVELEGIPKSAPMSLIRTLAHSPDRERRRTAYEAELASWKTIEVPVSAALNSVKGEVLTLCNRRGWNEPLDEALFNCNMNRETLDAMMTAARESYPDFRRYLRLKARALGIEKLAFYDIFAPIGESEDHWDYDSACDFVVKQFHSYSEKLGNFASRSFRENWVDVEPRPGKTDGAFCMGLRSDESRILMNYKPAFGAVSTLAHELGHAYHNLCLNGRTATQRSTPMTLAETASIFCETFIRQAVVRDGSSADQFSVLEASLQGSCQVVVDISSRFLFEQSVFEKRRKRELSAREMCELMQQAQLETYGDGLDGEALHPYMWEAKSHYYGRSYYNFPYMFGLLFGLGLYSVYQKEPDSFQDRYDDLLSSTGLADAATLGRRFGIDITTPDFWRASIDQIRADIDRFETMVGGVSA